MNLTIIMRMVLVFLLVSLCLTVASHGKTKMLTAKEYEEARKTQQLYVHAASIKNTYLFRELTFVRYWIENRGSTPAYFYWSQVPEIKLIDEQGNDVGDCSVLGHGESFYGRLGGIAANGEATAEYLELLPGERSAEKLIELTTSYGTGVGYDCVLPRIGSYRAFLPGFEGDTVQIKVRKPDSEQDSVALAMCESAIREVDLLEAAPSVIRVPLWRTRSLVQAKIYGEIFSQFPDSPYSLFAACKLLGYPLGEYAEVELRKRVEMRVLEVAEQGYMMFLMNLDPSMYDRNQREPLVKRFEELLVEYPATHAFSDQMRRILAQLREVHE